ncbi:tRNA threonylcarbamoyladenosine biosynthesis protein TsaE [Dehalogenimonas formicexedens]|uniref:tRNA threonylcarbamoyladenosine biosynthesis protein TsaE n=1 Tax=Dehalogenimonas formicexedens TaxID=1839801 RepID=A0A1P8F9R4_9CHLR|nr:tRNA (adenosine(37)-N6)-threonylcarbamoyltransferase complex ATPase subunit type 1 TsaE [Dehalogenimonas formicexedens]APV45206.1 tRNA threonylcarbamoyladenosine biosynthesis protein TsaE [Dehalogenimonas formicexedens]
MIFESKSAVVTRRFGEAIGKELKAGDVILLAGPLGAGKTTLVQGMARGLGVTGSVMSPTFVLARELEGRLTMYHVDLYRLEKMPEISDLGLDDYLYGDGVTVIEWADRAETLWPDDHLRIDLAYAGDKARTMNVTSHGKRYHKMMDKLALKFGDKR